MASEQRKVVFSGDVQGVGFRFTACRIAGRYDVTGYVRNLPDGRVECMVEGDGVQVGAFIDDLAETMKGYVRGRTESIAPYSGRFGGFTVAY